MYRKDHMPYRNLYLSQSEEDWVKEKAEGYIRTLIIKDMDGTHKGTQVKKISGENFPKRVNPARDALLNNLPDGVSVGLKPKSMPKEPGWCVNGHYAGVGMKTCKMCGGKVR